MKLKSYLIIFTLCIAAIACTKSSNKPEPETEPVPPATNEAKHRISFGFDDFEVTTTNGKEMNARDYLGHLIYIVYDSSGKKMHQIEQGGYSRQPVVGTISDSLTSGKYTVVLAGKNKGGDTMVSYMNGDYLYMLQFYRSLRNDVFYKKFVLNVSNKDTVINNLKLEKLTGNLEVRVLDTMPPNIASVDVMIFSMPVYFNVLNETLSTSEDEPVAPGGEVDPAQIGNGPIIFNTYHFGSSKKFHIQIRAWEYTNNVHRLVKQKDVDVVVYPNKKTILSGRLYPPSSPVGTTIPVTVDPDFAETINQAF